MTRTSSLTSTLTVALYALFIASWAVVASLPSNCPSPLVSVNISPLNVVPFALIALIALIALLVVQRLLKRRYVLAPGWCSQAVVWPLLLMGLVGAGLKAGCGALETAYPTLDLFAVMAHGSIWALRSQIALVAGLLGVGLFHWCARRAP